MLRLLLNPHVLVAVSKDVQTVKLLLQILQFLTWEVLANTSRPDNGRKAVLRSLLNSTLTWM